MTDFLKFIASLGPELFELFSKTQNKELNEENEKQLAMNIIRKAKDEQARKEILGV